MTEQSDSYKIDTYERRIVQYIYSDHRRKQNKPFQIVPAKDIKHTEMEYRLIDQVNGLTMQVHDLKNKRERKIIGVIIAERLDTLDGKGVFNVAYALCNKKDSDKFTKELALKIVDERVYNILKIDAIPRSIESLVKGFILRSTVYFKGCRMMNEYDEI